ncbi:major tail protein [Microbacterium phage Fransoyer]|nr:major tail protein [Microbacterium phage RubyRalph]QUE25579.1 major tail protein [Microbacterium phage SadLad]UUG69595.1 major tail protein [Microbacterium phage Fransoyer]
MVSQGRKAMRGRLARATRVDACGRVVFGEASQAVSKGFITAAWTVNTVETAAIEQENANGERCIYEGAKTRFVSYSLVLTFCEVDPEFFSLVTGQRVILDADGNAAGFAINSDVDLGDRGFALEIWAGAPRDNAACADPNAQGSYGYFLAPFLKGGLLGDYTVENGAINFTITGAVTQDGNGWGVGPYNVTLDSASALSPLLEPLEPNDHKIMIWVPVAPPEPFYGTRPLLDPTSTPVTALAAAEGGAPTEATFTFTGAAGEYVWIDFGDGEWDYVLASEGASHSYAKNGTFTAKASSNGTWVSTPVEIPFP